MAPAVRGSGVIARTRRTTTLDASTWNRATSLPDASTRSAFNARSRSATARAEDRAARRAMRQPALMADTAPFFAVFRRFGGAALRLSSRSRASAAAARARAASNTDAPQVARRSASRSAVSGSCAPPRRWERRWVNL